MELARFEVQQGVKSYKIGDEQVSLGNRLIAKLRDGEKFKTLLDYIKRHGVEFVYIRYTSNASPLYVNFLRKAKALGVKIYLEIPTYPYDGEFSSKNPYRIYNFKREQIFRRKLREVVDRIVTFSIDKEIFGIECINISNAIDFDSIELRERKPQHDCVKFLAVATLGFWHGYDRMIKALKCYYSSEPQREVYFDVVGGGPALESLKELTTLLGVEKYVHFYGKKEGEELTQIFQQADICVGSLGRHRSGIYEMKALKNVEYAARGIPFIYSETNPDFDAQPYTHKITPDEGDIDIQEIITNLDYQHCDPIAIRRSVAHLSWSSQMAIVSDILQK